MRRVLLLALVLACGKGLGERPCSENSDCPSPQKCVAGRCASTGFCIGSAACTDDAACATGQHCANGCCIPGVSGSCARDSDCSAHPKQPVCDTAQGQCVACLIARDCGPGKLCQNETCVALPGCASSRDCVAPTPVCDLQQHACVECLDSGDCLSLTKPTCDASHHCVAACTSNTDCADPTPYCLSSTGACVACLLDSNCPPGQVCDPVQNVCLQASATTCSSDKDCASNLSAQFCKITSPGKPGSCVQCLGDNQCASDQTCDASNTCVAKQCLGDPDCAAPTPKCLIGATPQICVACLTSPDCPNGGTCQPDHTCLAASACANCKPPTPACVNDVCVQCASPADCAAGETCSSQNTCVSTACGSDNDCKALAQTPHCDTSTGQCVQCTGDAQCAQGQKCAGDACAPVCTTATQAKDCPAATPVCRVSPFPMCVQCVAPTDCPSNQTCSASNTCVPKTGCTGPADCTNPALPVCAGGTCVQCATTADCKNNMGCDTTAHTCTLTGDSGELCNPDGSCNSGTLLCVDESAGSFCRPLCNPYAPSCAAGSVCSWLDFDANHALEGACTPKNNHGGVGASCDPSQIDSCEWNLICLPSSATASTCRALCDPASTACSGGVCNAAVGAVADGAPPVVEKFGFCAPAASAWGKGCTTDTGVNGPDCGASTANAGDGVSLFCTPQFLPIDGSGTVLATCGYTPADSGAIGGAGDGCTLSDGSECRTGMCVADLTKTCFSGCNPTADCTRDGASSTVFCMDIDFQTQKANVIASCLPACRDDADCTPLDPNRTCVPEQTHNGSSWRAICAPTSGSGKAGAACAGASDCASGFCVTGATLQSWEIDEGVPGFSATDGFCLGAALSTDCSVSGTLFSQSAALPITPLDGVQGVMGVPHPGVCWPQSCTRDAQCAGLSKDASAPRVCAPYKTTTMSSLENTASCTSDAQCTTVCNSASNNPNPGGLVNAGIFGPNGRCRAVSWALHCAPSLGGSKLGPGAACSTSDQCRTGHCLTPGGYCFGACASNSDCVAGTCKSGTYLGMSLSFCQP